MMNSTYRTKPYIRLSGSWLEEHGFLIGTQFKVEAEDNKLILEVIDEQYIGNG